MKTKNKTKNNNTTASKIIQEVSPFKMKYKSQYVWRMRKQGKCVQINGAYIDQRRIKY